MFKYLLVRTSTPKGTTPPRLQFRHRLMRCLIPVEPALSWSRVVLDGLAEESLGGYYISLFTH